VEFGLGSGLVVILPCVIDDVIARPQIFLDGFVEESGVAVVYIEFDDDRATYLRNASYLELNIYINCV